MGGVVPAGYQEYFIPIPDVTPELWQSEKDSFRQDVTPRVGLPGVPVTFFYPEDVTKKMYYPMVLIRRDDISPAMNRWHPGALQFRGAAPGASRFSYQAYPTSTPITGWDKVEERQQAIPIDLTYTIQIVARNRGSFGVKHQANRIFDHILRKYPPYCRVLVTDSVGDLRSYEAFTESINQVDEAAEVTDRMIGYAFTLRVEAELDHLDTEVFNTVRARAFGYTRR